MRSSTPILLATRRANLEQVEVESRIDEGKEARYNHVMSRRRNVFETIRHKLQWHTPSNPEAAKLGFRGWHSRGYLPHLDMVEGVVAVLGVGAFVMTRPKAEPAPPPPVTQPKVVEPEPPPAETVMRESPPQTGDWTDDVGVPGPNIPPPRPGPPSYQPAIDRARKLARLGLRRGREWVDRQRRH